MPERSWKEFEAASAKQPELLRDSRVWLLRGAEDFLLEQFKGRLVKELTASEDGDWGLEAFRLTPSLLRGTPPEGSWPKNILRAATTLPFFGDARVVLVEHVNLLPADAQKELAAALGSLPASTTLILAAKEGAAQKRYRLSTTLVKAASKHGTCLRFEALKGGEAVAWLQKAAAGVGKRIDKSAATFLVDRQLGPDLGSLKKELDKLALFAADDPSIGIAHIRQMTPRLLEENIYALADELSRGRRGQANAVILVRKLLAEKQEPTRLLYILASHFRLLWQAKALLESGWHPKQPIPQNAKAAAALLAGRDSIAAVFSRRSWVAGKVASQARAFSWPQLERALLLLRDLDLALKGLSYPPRRDSGMALEIAVIRLSA